MTDGLVDYLIFGVPPRSFEEETVDVTSISRCDVHVELL